MSRPPQIGPRFPLRLTVLAVVASVNVAVFGAGYWWLSDRIDDQREDLGQVYAEVLGERLAGAANQGDLWSTGLLRWDGWPMFQDVFVAHLPELSGMGMRGTGVLLNPRGAAHRRPDFDEDLRLAAIADAALAREPKEVAGGLALPVYLEDGQPWGGAWVVTDVGFGTEAFAASLLPLFLLTTSLMTLLTTAALQKLILQPVQGLAAASQRIARGDLSARVAEPARRDELSELCRGFNQMAATVEGYQANLEMEVQDATQAAREAEQGAMTQRRLAATGELAAGVAHEINNPLGGLLNAVESLSRPDLPPERRERYLELVRGGLDRIRDTVGRLLRMAPRETETGPLALVQPLADALGLVRHRAGTQGVQLVLMQGETGHEERPGLAVELFGGLPQVLGQGNELGQAILNLLVNALDSLGAQGPNRHGAGDEIRVTLERQSGFLRLAVRDNGPGASEDTLRRAGDLFFTTKDQGKGTGLGLAHVHSVVAGHGGELRLSSEEGRFFQAEVLLPLPSKGGATPGDPSTGSSAGGGA